tara:strand:+ start:348 stop:923 length:576 start_codon:yes stop_codon:yes gene_type:complete
MVVEDILKALDLLTRGAQGDKNKYRSFDKKRGLSIRKVIERGVKSGQKAEGLSKADANKLISILEDEHSQGPEIKEAAAKPAPAGSRPEKELTFGQKFKEERAKAKKAGKELTATFTYKGKSYHTRNEKEEATRKEKASARTSGKGTKAVTITDLAPPKKTKPKTKKANRGALVSRQRKGHTDMRKGGLFR